MTWKILSEAVGCVLFVAFVVCLSAWVAATIKASEGDTQPAIQTAIVTVRGCDVIQHIQGDRLIAAHNAADQPKTCKAAK